MGSVGEQVIYKTKRLDFIAQNLSHAGRNDLELWRVNVLVAVEQLASEIQNLGNRVDTTYNGCAELKRRINHLEGGINACKERESVSSRYNR